MCVFKDRRKVEALFPNAAPLAPGDCLILEEINALKIHWSNFTSQRVVEEADRTVRKHVMAMTGSYGEEWSITLLSVRQNGVKEPCLRVDIDIDDKSKADDIYQLQVGLALQNKDTGAIFSKSKEFAPHGSYPFEAFVPLDEDDLPDRSLIDKNGDSELHIYLSLTTGAHVLQPLEQTSELTWEMRKSDLLLQFSKYIDFEGAHLRIVYLNYNEETPSLVLERDGYGVDKLGLEVELFAVGPGAHHQIMIHGNFRHHDQKGFSEPDFVNCTSFGFRICRVSR